MAVGDFALWDANDVRGDKGGAPHPPEIVLLSESMGEVGDVGLSALPMSGLFRPC